MQARLYGTKVFSACLGLKRGLQSRFLKHIEVGVLKLVKTEFPSKLPVHHLTF